MTTHPRRLWQIAGVLAIAHVVLIPVGIALQRAPLFQRRARGHPRAYVEGDLARTFTGGVLEAFGFLLLVPALVFLAPRVRASYRGRRLGRADRSHVRPRPTSP